MVLFQLPQRYVGFKGGFEGLQSPFEISLTINLGPEEFFGASDVTGRLRELVDEGDRQLEFSPFQGIRRPKPKQQSRARTFSYSGKYSGVPIIFEGSKALMHFIVDELDTLGDFVQRVIETLPAMFAPVSLAPISILSMSGTANGRPFEVVLNGTITINKFSVSKVKDYFDLAMLHARNLPRQIIAAKRYLAQNYLLEYSSEFGNQFTGERILNLCKSLESLLPAQSIDSIDKMRVFLRDWGVHEKYVDVFSSIRYLRSQLDVAHISYSAISSEAHESIDRFIVLAEACVQALIQTAVKKYIEDVNIYPQRRAVVDDCTAVRFLKNYKDLERPENGDLSTVPSSGKNEIF